MGAGGATGAALAGAGADRDDVGTGAGLRTSAGVGAGAATNAVPYSCTSKVSIWRSATHKEHRTSIELQVGQQRDWSRIKLAGWRAPQYCGNKWCDVTLRRTMEGATRRKLKLLRNHVSEHFEGGISMDASEGYRSLRVAQPQTDGSRHAGGNPKSTRMLDVSMTYATLDRD